VSPSRSTRIDPTCNWAAPDIVTQLIPRAFRMSRPPVDSDCAAIISGYWPARRAMARSNTHACNTVSGIGLFDARQGNCPAKGRNR